MTTFVVMRQDFVRDAWEPIGSLVDAETPERAVKFVLQGQSVAVFGTFVAIPHDDFTQFVEDRPRVVVSVHIETLHPAGNAA